METSKDRIMLSMVQINTFLLIFDFFTGNLKNWWQPSAKENYLEKTKCIIGRFY